MPNTLVPLPRDASGALRLPGLSEFRYEVDFTRATTMPSTVTVTGTGALTGNAANGTGRGQFTTGTTSGASCGIALTTAVDPTVVKSAIFTVDMEWPASGWTPNFFFELKGTPNLGFGWRAHEMLIRSASGNGAAVALPAPSTLRQAGRVVRTRLSLLLLPGEKIVGLLNGGEVVTAAIMPENVLTGPLTPQLTGQLPAAGAAGSFSVLRAEVIQRQ